METRSLRKVVWIAAAVAVAALGAAALIGVFGGIFGPTATGIWAGGVPVDRRESFPAAGVDRITVHAVSAEVSVADGADERVTVRLVGTAGSRRGGALPALEAEAQGGAVEIRVHPPKGTFLFYTEKLELRVEVPRGYAGKLAVTTVSGDIEVADHAYAALALRTASGDVRLAEVQADSFSMGSVSGRLQARGVAARQVELGSTSGELAIEALTGDVRARSVSGAIRLAWTPFANTADIDTTSGEVALRLPRGSAFRLDAASTSGEITCGFPITVAGSGPRAGRRALHGEVGDAAAGGGGGNLVKVRTVSGEIRLTP